MSGFQNLNWIGRELASGRYRVDALLGEGGMGAVYRAWDKNLGTEVVVKVPHASMLQDAEFAARFAREISSLVKLSHPHIVKITDVGEHDGLPFAVMQFLPGGSLEDRQKSDACHLTQARSASEGSLAAGSTADSLARASGLYGAEQSSTSIRALPPDSLKSWLPSIAEALDFVHNQGYIHRDVKPANILFDAHGHAYLSDFGIAKSAATGPSAASNKTLTGAGMVIGTPEYMAPELIMGQGSDGRVDQYALGITVFEILAGRRPFEHATTTAVLVMQSNKEPPDLASLNSNIPANLPVVVRQALSKSPNERFPNCRQFADAVLATLPASASPKTQSVEVKCPLCQGTLKLAEKLRGKDVRCPICKSLLHVSDDLRALTPSSSGYAVPAAGTGTRVVGSGLAAIVGDQEADVTRRFAKQGTKGAFAVALEQETTGKGTTHQTSASTEPTALTNPLRTATLIERAGDSRATKLSAEEHSQQPNGHSQQRNGRWNSILVGGAAVVLLLGITLFVSTPSGNVRITIIR